MNYDLLDRLTGIDPAGSTNDAVFTFDALSRIKDRTINGGTPDTYSYAGGSSAVIRIAGSTTTDSLLDATGARLGVKVGTTVNWFLPDLHGDIAGSVDQSGATVLATTRYDAYGMTLATGGSGSVGAANWRYQGRLDISPAGLSTPLYSAGARDYSPGLGTFISFDSTMGKAADPISMNRYLYAVANPATMIDPDGHCATRQIDLCDYQNEQAAKKHGQAYKSKWAGDNKPSRPKTGAVAPQNTPRVDAFADGYLWSFDVTYVGCGDVGNCQSWALDNPWDLDSGSSREKRLEASIGFQAIPLFGDAYQAVTILAGTDPVAGIQFSAQDKQDAAGLFITTAGIGMNSRYAREFDEIGQATRELSVAREFRVTEEFGPTRYFRDDILNRTDSSGGSIVWRTMESWQRAATTAGGGIHRN
jgi:RHS repeat-associated protein